MVLGLITGDPLFFVTVYFSLFMSSFFILTFMKNKKKLGNPRIKKYRKVSILIAAYNEADSIAETIENALSLDWPKDKLEVMVIENNGSTDGTYEIAKRYQKRGVRVFSLKKGGKGNALNFGIKKARGEIIVSMDAHTYAEPDALKKMVVYFDDPEVMAASPAILALKPKTFAQKVQNTEYLFGVFLRKVFHFLNTVYVTPGAFTAYRKSFFEKYGGYDTTNITEDFEMCLRIQSKGYKVTNSINARVYTETPKTLIALHKQRLRWFLGFIETALKYNSLFFNTRNGLLSALILPTAVLSIALTLLIFVRAMWTFGKDLINAIQNYYIVKSIDLLPMLYSVKLDPFFYQIGILLFATLVLIMMSLYMYFSARKYSGDKEAFAVSYLIYFIFYLFVFSFWWLHAIYFKLFGKKLRFGGVEWNNSILTILTKKAQQML